MGDLLLLKRLNESGVADWRIRLANWVDSDAVQRWVISAIVLNGLILGLETNEALMESWGVWLKFIDKALLAVFTIEIALKLLAYRQVFFRSGWNLFDFLVVAVAFVPGAGPWSVLRTLRVFRVLRLLTAVPQLKRVVAAFIHAIPGLSGVMLVMAIFFYTMAILATTLFGEAFPEWFGTLGASLYSLFQVMTLESWSMGIVRPVMEVYPWAWAFFVPFIVIATFTILNLFIGIIVSTMQELSVLPDPATRDGEILRTLGRMEDELERLRAQLRNR
ncbi:ion transporter [Pelagicoccus sp. SDUM812003]|uniref:ion transporter n=1 Tax=Pelagicoccus sp. SDUM812003 TaxID=3041267 RepID=UPI00280D272D|nr:ion transporter [Pelagicoccus sp. SDUM812003]MDQ8204290.1 ion transporter [Pelagicoccus sp. SDUM812003]